MTRAAVVQYHTTAVSTERNCQLIEDVLVELAARDPGGLHYQGAPIRPRCRFHTRSCFRWHDRSVCRVQRLPELSSGTRRPPGGTADRDPGRTDRFLPVSRPSVLTETTIRGRYIQQGHQ